MLFKTVKVNSNNTVPIKDKQSKVLSSEEEQNQQSIEQFREVLNQLDLPSFLNFDSYEVNTNEIRITEVLKAIKILKNNTFSGTDNITTRVTEAWRTRYCTKIWKVLKLHLNRLKDDLDRRLQEEQAGLCSGRSCSKQILTLRYITEQSCEFDQKVFINFVDFRHLTAFIEIQCVK